MREVLHVFVVGPCEFVIKFREWRIWSGMADMFREWRICSVKFQYDIGYPSGYVLWMADMFRNGGYVPLSSGKGGYAVFRDEHFHVGVAVREFQFWFCSLFRFSGHCHFFVWTFRASLLTNRVHSQVCVRACRACRAFSSLLRTFRASLLKKRTVQLFSVVSGWALETSSWEAWRLTDG